MMQQVVEIAGQKFMVTADESGIKAEPVKGVPDYKYHEGKATHPPVFWKKNAEGQDIYLAFMERKSCDRLDVVMTDPEGRVLSSGHLVGFLTERPGQTAQLYDHVGSQYPDRRTDTNQIATEHD